jgi:hypothetical protein
MIDDVRDRLRAVPQRSVRDILVAWRCADRRLSAGEGDPTALEREIEQLRAEYQRAMDQQRDSAAELGRAEG